MPTPVKERLTPEELGTKILTGYNGKEIAPQVFVIGNIQWFDSPYDVKKNESAQLMLPGGWRTGNWRCLANVCGSLCIIAVEPRRLS